ncbi:SDR family NAD(P)-dependent oxidoreductase [Pseudomonadota bacterium]
MITILDNISTYLPREDLLKNKTILVTGAAAGIGRAVAIGFAEHGASTILLDKSNSGLNETYDFIAGKQWPLPTLIHLDLATASESVCNDIARQIEQEFGKLNGLLHNAAELGTLTPIHLYNLETWSKVMRVNFYIPYLLTRACWPLCLQAENASVLFTTSEQSRRGKAYWGAYGAAGSAMENMMQTWSLETENKSLRFNSIDPGRTQTDMRSYAYPGDVSNKDIKAPESLRNAYLYLMSSDSIQLRGRQLTVSNELQLLSE